MTMILIAVLVVVAVVLVGLGLLAPRVSRRLQHRVDRGSQKAEGAAEQHAGSVPPVEKAVEGSAKMTQKATDVSSELGRKGHDKLEQ